MNPRKTGQKCRQLLNCAKAERETVLQRTASLESAHKSRPKFVLTMCSPVDVQQALDLLALQVEVYPITSAAAGGNPFPRNYSL